jgi:hypothetical protein
MNNIESLVVGVVSGIVTAVILYLLLILFNRIVLPWYRQLVYQGVDIAGKWEEHLDFGNGKTQVITAELTQKANSITGNVTIVKAANGQITRTEIMFIKGTIKDRLFSATLIPVDKKRVGMITTLLEVVGDGGRMSGWASWYDVGMARITGQESEWIRI